MLNAPSMANSPLLDLGANLAELVDAGIEIVHIDIMDGHYVPNLCFPLSVVEEIKHRYPGLVVDAHLMVEDVAGHVDRLAALGCDAVSFPTDATRFARRMIARIQDAGMRAGIVLNPSQPITTLEPLVHLADYIVLMSVEPGFAGQRFLPGSLERLARIAELAREEGVSPLIEIDGGIDDELAEECLSLGAEVLVTNVYTVFVPGLTLSQGVGRFTARMAAAGHEHDAGALERLRRGSRR